MAYGRKGEFKTGQKRDKPLVCRLSESELLKLDELVSKLQKTSWSKVSRTDAIMLAIGFANGELTPEISRIQPQQSPTD